MARPRRVFSWIFLTLLIALTTAAALWLGLVPQRYSPLSPVSLDEPDAWFLDLKLAALHQSAAQCAAVLKAPKIESMTIPDEPIRKGCGWKNAVKVSSAGGASIGVDKVTCEVAAAFAMWVTYDVQPEALAVFGSKVTSIENFGTYSCRNIVGNPFWKDMRSQHATANAIDVASLTLENGKKINVLKDWKGDTSESRFLKKIHARACRYFRVALGPDFNPAHENHFHFDRGVLKTCK